MTQFTYGSYTIEATGRSFLIRDAAGILVEEFTETAACFPENENEAYPIHPTRNDNIVILAMEVIDSML